jgi:pyrophosphatase PpaX
LKGDGFVIRTVLFDLDGTIIDTNRLILESWRHALGKHLGICPDERELIGYFGEPLIVTARRFDEANAEMLCAAYREFNVAMHDSMVKKIDGVDETISGLKALGIRVGIVTSKKRLIAERGLKNFNLLGLMDVLVTIEDTRECKPQGEPVIKALELLDISPAEALYVGDTHYDILCARNAACRSCAVKYSMVPLDELMKHDPDYILDNLTDLIEIVSRENAAAV